MEPEESTNLTSKDSNLQSRREFVKTNLGRLVAGAVIVSGMSRVAMAASCGHTNCWQDTVVDPTDPFPPYQGHINTPLNHTNVAHSNSYTDQSYHTNGCNGGSHTNFHTNTHQHTNVAHQDECETDNGCLY